MRGNPIIEIIAILVMLASVLVGGGYWLINKQAQQQIKEIRQDLNKVHEKPLTFEKAVKETKE